MGSYGGDEEIITTKQIVCCFCCYFENATVNNNKCFILYVSICQFRRYFSSSLRGSWWQEADFFSHFYLTKVLAPFLRWSILKRHFQRTRAVSTAWSLPGPKANARRRKRKATSTTLSSSSPCCPSASRGAGNWPILQNPQFGQCRMPSKEISPRIKSPDK